MGTLSQDRIFELLGRWLDLEATELAEASDLARRGGYEQFRSEERAIESPIGALYTAQARIQQVFLAQAPVASAAHGGVPGRSILSHARVHLPSARSALCMDVADAYRSVRFGPVKTALRRALRPMLRDALVLGDERKDLIHFLTRLCCFRGRLPVGAPTSATLFNLVAGGFDKAMEKLVGERLGRGGRYSRYLDDIAVSSDIAIPHNFEKKIARALKVHDLGEARPDKTRRMSAGAIAICGIAHDGRGLALTSERLSTIKDELDRCRGDAALRPRARGLLRFVRSVYGVERVPPAIAAAAAFLGGEPS